MTEKVLKLKRDWVFGMDWKTISDPLNPNVNRFVCVESGFQCSMFRQLFMSFLLTRPVGRMLSFAVAPPAQTSFLLHRQPFAVRHGLEKNIS